MIRNWSSTEVTGLIGPDRVHRSVYRDPAIFEMEMERIFRRAWLFVGHDSQVRKPGDFVCTMLAAQPVVLVRHRDGAIHVLFNRCGHRGAVVVNEPRGNARHFRCCYHGWIFRTNGELQSAPLKNGYGEHFDFSDPAMGMVRVPRVESYRGFIFASLSPEGPDLHSYLGPMLARIDDIVDRAPEGAVSMTGGVHKYEVRGNWKLQIENLNDLYHPPYSHESTTRQDGRQFTRRGGEAHLSNGAAPVSQWDETGVWVFANGHSYCGAIPSSGEPESDTYRAYASMLEARLGKVRAAAVLKPDWHNAILYPNLCIQAMSQHVRVIHPVAVDRTHIHVYPILLDGAPPELNRAVIRYLNVTHAPASLIQTDDLEAFRRIQEGLATEGSDWVVFARGIDDEIPTEGGRRGLGTSELPMRNQYRTWLSLLTQGHHGAA